MLTKSGVKLLDFGLAKLKGDAGPTSTLSQMPTADASKPLTQEGAIVGTLQYMAPEQLEGRDVDARTDIFAFGAVVYEMVTGKRAFEGKSQASLIGAIMNSEPQSMTELEAMTPRSLNHIVRRCLAKDPDERWQVVSDVMREIKWATEVGPEEQVASAVASRRFPVAWASALAIMAIITIASVVMNLSPVSTTNDSETRVEMTTPSTLDPASFALSPDGRSLVFVAAGNGQSQLWLRSLSTDTAEPLEGTEGASLPFWSPDARSIAFFADNQLKRIDIGGAVQVLASANAPRGGTWGPDGNILFTPIPATGIVQVSAGGGETTPVEDTQNYPLFLPNGRQFLFSWASPRGIYLGSLDSPERKLLVETDSQVAAFHPAGYLLFIRDGNLFAQRFNPEEGELAGDPLTVANQVVDRALSVSASGTIAYRRNIQGSQELELNWFDRDGVFVRSAAENGDYQRPRISPDGSRILAMRDGDLWIMDNDSTAVSQFTFTGNVGSSGVWSPDGRRIAFTRGGLFHRSSTGEGNDESLLSQDSYPGNNQQLGDWSSDGRFFLFLGFAGSIIGADLWVVETNGNREASPYLANETYVERGGQFSPNVRWIAYDSNESERNEIYIRPFPNADDGRWRVSTKGGSWVRWSRDGRELYYLTPEGTLMVVPTDTTGETFQWEPATALFQTRIPPGALSDVMWPYDVGPDGRFVMSVVGDQETDPITLIKNH